ncbi:hypothetical protein [Streptomyces spectabilis]|uniref:Uncharacterized protein n=1 Tax=Streptomyces spectabilis TaxID=68270 RepID=A0A7W8B5B6_STRST|nr:hypothetical protein [Streptomyces spectabilis]MBB5109986.1 hypothetical protein [Streptomyces spectabilis]GGV57338.1 hypothetical protein GCM10010245_90440 [Streptomyces spectabilis]
MTKRTAATKTTAAKASKGAAAKNPKADERTQNGGLKKDAALDAFSLDSGAALAAFAPRTPQPAAAPDPDPAEESAEANSGGVEVSAPVPAPAHEATPLTAPVAQHTVAPPVSPAAPAEPHQVVVPHVPELHAANSPGQCTVMVHSEVRKRFLNYQTATKVQTGVEPTNAVVVKRAFLHAKKHDLWASLREQVRQRQQPVSAEDDDPDGLFEEVPTRRVDRCGTKHGVQQSFRPTPRELTVYDTYASTYGFDNRSEFLDAVLDGFLPQLPAKRPPR